MAWDFSTDAEWATQLAWVEQFVREECEPVDLVVEESHDLDDPVRQALIPPLQRIVKDRGLWATHLGPHLGGPGHGQVKLALLNEILGRSESAPIVFGSQAPDSGNSEILAHYGTPKLKERYLEPLLDNRIVSCFSMTEPQGGADPKVFTTSAVPDGDEWVINGEKWFSSFARWPPSTLDNPYLCSIFKLSQGSLGRCPSCRCGQRIETRRTDGGWRSAAESRMHPRRERHDVGRGE